MLGGGHVPVDACAVVSLLSGSAGECACGVGGKCIGRGCDGKGARWIADFDVCFFICMNSNHEQ